MRYDSTHVKDFSLLTFDLNHEAGGETGPDTVEAGAEELPRVVGAHEDAGLRAVHRRVPDLDPRDASHGRRVRHLARDREQRVLAPVRQRSYIGLQDDGGQI